ncbi:NAC domain-containing protein 72-like [Salvia splendens]|uniref:NAC domain-containing protein 72-like n=1 Tax=Salvia splendens TaxID=180675 RepID=UPI001C262139|nr:NAC domain-containing protein 72-like [Salvia splendens]
MGDLAPVREFKPADEEIILEYLMRKINNEAFHTDMINTVQFYASTPDNISQMHRASGDRVWYYFTQRRRKHRRGHQVDRTAGDGYWKVIGALKRITHNGERIGLRRLFVYSTGTYRDSVQTDWLMQEFTVPENRARMGDWVGCKMYKTTRQGGSSSLIRDAVNESRSSRKRNHDGEANNNPTYAEVELMKKYKIDET